mmetsp:Transcript_6629/g.5732  ORF Transcript_6629/g.5732 Transcript_6629/m.5732 type:complete len:185 (+) Transcript_6629:422-976(+)
MTLDGTPDVQTLNIQTYLPLGVDFGSTQENLCIFLDTPHEIITENMAEATFGTIVPGQDREALSAYWKGITQSEHLTKEKFMKIKEKTNVYESGERIKINIEEITHILKNARDYVEGVEAGRIEGDSQIDLALNSALSKIGHVTPDSVNTLVKDHYEDLAYIEKLADLIKDQLALSEKLISDNK